MKTLKEKFKSIRIRLIKKRLDKNLKRLNSQKKNDKKWRHHLLRIRVWLLKDLIELLER